jgi:VCBS repeat-containing protein
MPTFRVKVEIDHDGVPLPGFPVVRRLELDEGQQYEYEKAADADAVTFSALPGEQVDDIRLLAIQTDQQVTIRVDGQSDAGIIVNAGGILVLFDVTIDAGAGASNAKINNNSGSVADIRGVIGGT